MSVFMKCTFLSLKNLNIVDGLVEKFGLLHQMNVFRGPNWRQWELKENYILLC